MNGNRQLPPAEWLTDPGPERRRWMGACVRSHELILERACTSHPDTPHQRHDPSCDWPDFTQSGRLDWLTRKPLYTETPSSLGVNPHPPSLCWTPKTSRNHRLIALVLWHHKPDPPHRIHLGVRPWGWNEFNTKTQQPPQHLEVCCCHRHRQTATLKPFCSHQRHMKKVLQKKSLIINASMLRTRWMRN